MTDSLCEFRPGDRVTYVHESRGGYGFIVNVPAYVVKVAAKRIGIAALHSDRQTWLPRWVAPENLRPDRTWTVDGL